VQLDDIKRANNIKDATKYFILPHLNHFPSRLAVEFEKVDGGHQIITKLTGAGG